MRTIEEVLTEREMTVEEFKVINRFWTEIRAIQGRRDAGVTKNRYLVGVAMGFRRMYQREIDLETLVSLTGLGRSSLQKTLKSMEDDKLIRLEKDTTDKRRTLVKPTQRYIDLSLDMYEETRDLVEKTAHRLKEVKTRNDH